MFPSCEVSVSRLNMPHINHPLNRHAPPGFWAPICAAAGVFCMGEVFGSDINEAASYQGSGALDSVLNYPLYDALVNAFGLPGPQNMTGLVQVMSQSKRQYKVRL